MEKNAGKMEGEEGESNQRRGKGIVRESNEGTNDGSH